MPTRNVLERGDTRLGRDMAGGRRKPIKLVLLGIGEEVDRAQLERFDDMFEGSGIHYDLWSYGLVASMQDEADILADIDRALDRV